jgi:hypothetical protein
MLREVVRWSSIVLRHRSCAAAMAARSTWANVACGIPAICLPLARLFNSAIHSSYQLSGPAVWEQLSGPAVWMWLSGPAVWEQLSGPAVWEQLSGPAVREQLSGPAVWVATTFSLPVMYLMSAVNSAT